MKMRICPKCGKPTHQAGNICIWCRYNMVTKSGDTVNIIYKKQTVSTKHDEFRRRTPMLCGIATAWKYTIMFVLGLPLVFIVIPYVIAKILIVDTQFIVGPTLIFILGVIPIITLPWSSMVQCENGVMIGISIVVSILINATIIGCFLGVVYTAKNKSEEQ